MAVTTMRQMPNTEIDYSFKSELLGDLGSSPQFIFYLALLADYVIWPHLKKSLVTAMSDGK